MPKEPTPDEKPKPKCLISIPLGANSDTYYEDIFIPAIEEAGFIAIRADDLYSAGDKLNNIGISTKEATVLLADLTGKNAVVLYQLGLAHAITRAVILITASMEDVPSDLRTLRVIDYDKNLLKWDNLLQKKITHALLEISKNPYFAIAPTFFESENAEKQE
ncbi:MAG: hypothetical protein WCH34_01545 [Bacteroidota bacterium]